MIPPTNLHGELWKSEVTYHFVLLGTPLVALALDGRIHRLLDGPRPPLLGRQVLVVLRLRRRPLGAGLGLFLATAALPGARAPPLALDYGAVGSADLVAVLGAALLRPPALLGPLCRLALGALPLGGLERLGDILIDVDGPLLDIGLEGVVLFEVADVDVGQDVGVVVGHGVVVLASCLDVVVLRRG